MGHRFSRADEVRLLDGLSPETCFWVGYRFSAAAIQTENYFDFTVEERAFRPASEVRDESGFSP